MTSEILILVDKDDAAVGQEEKTKSHLGDGILHRAFAAFVINDKGQLLIQKRSKHKLLWPLVWENSCSSHPTVGQNYIEAGQDRLKHELGFTCCLKKIGKFQYQAKFKDVGSENEICAILLGKYSGQVKPNPDEVADWRWVAISELERDIVANPQDYTPWLKTGLAFIGFNASN